MRDAERTRSCRSCGRDFPEEQLDRQRWCRGCREEVIRRATVWARATAVLVAVGLGIWIALSLQGPSRFIALWVALLVGVYLFVLKLVRRIAFEVIRARRTPAPPAP